MTSTVTGEPTRAYGDGGAAIRDAALGLALERGISALTLRAVAERAGVAHSLVRHHFGSRDRLVAEVVRAAVANTHYLGREQEEPLSSRIERTFGELRIQYEIMLAGEHAETIAAAYRGYRDETAQWIRARGVDASPALVALVVSVIDGVAVQRLAEPSSVDADAVLGVLEHLLAAAAGGPGAANAEPR